jgi:hypothetical protein
MVFRSPVASIFIALLLFSYPSFAVKIDLPDCTQNMPTGTKCRGKISEFRPTEPDDGDYEVKVKTDDYEDFSHKKMRKLLQEKPVPVVIGPDGALYLIDHHHTARALWNVGQKHMIVTIQDNWSHLGAGHPNRMRLFWDKMILNGDCYLKLVSGETVDPLSPSFPQNLNELGNNPYRSLIDLMSKNGDFVPSGLPYDEFHIAEVFIKGGLKIPQRKIKKKEWDPYLEEAEKMMKDDSIWDAIKPYLDPDSICDNYFALGKRSKK